MDMNQWAENEKRKNEEARRKADADLARTTAAISTITPVLLPAGLVPHRVHIHAHRADAAVVFEVGNDWRPEVKRIMDVLKPVPLVRYTDSSLSFFPQSQVKRGEQELIDEGRAKASPIAPFVFTANKTVGEHQAYPDEVNVQWWSEVGGLLFRVECRLTGNLPIRYEHVIIRDGKRIIGKRWDIHTDFNAPYRDKFWSETGKPNPHTFYWPDASLTFDAVTR